MTRQIKQDAEEPPRRRNRAQPVGSDTRVLGGLALARVGFSDATLVLHWEQIVGPEIARLSRPVKLVDGSNGGTLTLKAEPAASVFLQHEARSLCERINTYLGRPAVSRVRFVYGSLALRGALPSKPRPRQSAPDNDPAACFSGPDGLRAALLALAGTRTTQGTRSSD